MKIRKQERHDAKQLFRGCQVHGLLDENRVRQTVQALIERKPRGYLPILEHLKRLVALEMARRTATVESAVALPEDLRQSVQANLSRLYGQGLFLQFRQDPDLLGGLRIRVGSDVYDGSVRARLAVLQESF
jgi:F-type H+-transporting ATPase subunit delta